MTPINTSDRAEPSKSQALVLELAQIEKKKRKRITTDGLHLLKELCDQWPSSEPPLKERKVVLGQIRAMPGNEHYTDDKMVMFLRRMRKKRTSDAHQSSIQTIPHPEYRALAPEAVEMLEAVLHKYPKPDETLIQTWAKLLTVDADDIREWIRNRLPKPRAHFPTPSDSSTPEPIQHFKTDPPSPTIEAKPFAHIHFSPSGPSTPSPLPLKPFDQNLKSVLALALAESKSFPSPPVSEQDAHLELDKFSRTSLAFLDMVKSGSLQDSGWTS